MPEAANCAAGGDRTGDAGVYARRLARVVCGAVRAVPALGCWVAGLLAAPGFIRWLTFAIPRHCCLLRFSTQLPRLTSRLVTLLSVVRLACDQDTILSSTPRTYVTLSTPACLHIYCLFCVPLSPYLSAAAAVHYTHYIRPTHKTQQPCAAPTASRVSTLAPQRRKRCKSSSRTSRATTVCLLTPSTHSTKLTTPSNPAQPTT